MQFIIVLLAVAFLAACAVCAFKESRITGTYKAAGVYGRIKAYLALDFTAAGAVAALGGIAGLFTEEGRAQGVGSLLGYIAIGAVLLALGVFIYMRAYAKCPPALKKKCISSMILSGLGVSIKIAVFFIPAVWALSTAGAPSEGSDGTSSGPEVEVWRNNGMMRENLKVNSTGDMYYDPEDGQWHKIQKS